MTHTHTHARERTHAHPLELSSCALIVRCAGVLNQAFRSELRKTITDFSRHLVMEAALSRIDTEGASVRVQLRGTGLRALRCSCGA